jgi:hypothetical protein
LDGLIGTPPINYPVNVTEMGINYPVFALDGRVDDVMHLHAFGKAQKEICRLAAWEELVCLRPGAVLENV